MFWKKKKGMAQKFIFKFLFNKRLLWSSCTQACIVCFIQLGIWILVHCGILSILLDVQWKDYYFVEGKSLITFSENEFSFLELNVLKNGMRYIVLLI